MEFHASRSSEPTISTTYAISTRNLIHTLPAYSIIPASPSRGNTGHDGGMRGEGPAPPPCGKRSRGAGEVPPKGSSRGTNDPGADGRSRGGGAGEWSRPIKPGSRRVKAARPERFRTGFAQRNGRERKSPDGRLRGRMKMKVRSELAPPVFPILQGHWRSNGQTGNGVWRGWSAAAA
jgi:hypothetical protein